MPFHSIIIKFEIWIIVYNIYLKHSAMMAERAFVLINTNERVDDDLLLAQLKKIDGISEAYKTSGIYNILIKVEAETIDKVASIVNHKLKNLEDIQSTLTMVAIRNR
jgi:DNA-binding Lrp family transcriptional regulator